MRFKATIVIALMTIVLLANVTAIAFNVELPREETDSVQDLNNHQATWAADKDGTSYPMGIHDSSQPSNPETQKNRFETSGSDIFCPDSFGKDTSSQKMDMWGAFAYVDEDSAELVIGVDYAQPDAYTKLIDLIVENGGKLADTVLIGDEGIAIVADMPTNEASSFVAKVQASSLARYVEPNMKFQTQFVPNDPYWSWQWGPQKIEADWAWNTTKGDPSILVAVIDTGIDYDHPDLAANYVKLGYDWVNDDPDPMDDNGHGTHCAGIVAAVLNNGIGIAGLARVKIMAEKGLDQYGGGYEDKLAKAIVHAVNQGADILSNSWSGSGDSALIHDAVKYAYDKGVLVVAAAGNAASSVRLYPAAYDEVIAVTATDQSDNPAWFTNFGKWVEVAAPGVDIYSTYWDDTYTSLSGTSMSTPHVSGTAALIWSQFPNMTRDWVRAQLRYTADDLGDAGFDDYYGYGRINARKAVEQAPPDHDLLIFDFERPQLIKLGGLATFNTTVLNFGTSNETNVEIQLLVNGSLVDSASIAFLQWGASATVGLSWTPSAEGKYNVTSYVIPVPGETVTRNNLITEIVAVVAPPPDAYWILQATDPDEGPGTNLQMVYGQLYSSVIFFKVIHYRPWTTITDIDDGILIDADQNLGTGLPDRTYPGQNTGIGADYVIIVGWEATAMWRWDPIKGWWDTDSPIPLAYLDAPEDSNVFVVGVYLADIQTIDALDGAVSDIRSNWDWMPDAGHFTLPVVPDKLAVSLEAPTILEPGASTVLNATVQNRGLTNETNVGLHLLINGTLVDSVIIPELLNGSSYTLSYSWTPTIEGIYNVTAYAPPVPKEEFIQNNISTKMVRVRTIKGYVLFDQTHWTDSIWWYSIWVNNLFDRGYVIDTLTTSPITPSALNGYDMFVIPQAHDYYSSSELTAIQDFVRKSGGGLLIIGDDAPYIYSDLTRFAGITWDWGGYWGYTNDITPHPVTEGVNTAYFDSPGKLYVSLQAKDLIRDMNKNIMLAVSEVEAGAVIGIADENTIIDWNIHYADNLRLANNMIDWLKSRPPRASFTYSPLDPYVGETVTFNASASYDPDGTIASYLWNFGDGASGDSVVTTHTYAAGGTFNVTLTVVDNEGLNSTSTKGITVLRTAINVQVKVGSIHFRGEIAEFYVLVSSLGKPVDASVKATLYFKGEPYEDLSASVEHVSLGLYRIPYTIPLTASIGTYALVVEGSYLSLSGISLESFLLSPTLTGWNALLVSINGTVGTVKTDLGLIKVKLDAIDAKLIRIEGTTATINSTAGLIKTDLDTVNTKISTINGTLVSIKSDIGLIQVDIADIQLEVTAINGTIATIQTTLGTISGKITSIENNIATIKTDVGIMKTKLEGWTGGTTSLITTPLGTFQILVLTTSTLEGPITFSDNVLMMSLSGLTGTTGTINVVIPKQLLTGIEKVAVTIDDKPVVFTYTEQPEAYVLSMAYTHSTHTIKIYLAGLPPTLPLTLYIIATAIIILAVSASLAIYMLKIRKPRIAKTK